MEATLAALRRDGMSEAEAAALADGAARFHGRPFRASTPTFRHYEVEGLEPCRVSRRFPAFSITGPACALNCRHCQAGILAPMIPATSPADLDRLARQGIERDGMAGFLLSGGSNKRNEVPFERWLPVVKALKRDHPHLEIAVHTGLADARRAGLLADAGVDVAMLDIIGDDETVRQVYHLDRPAADFAASLRELLAAGLRTVPHVVVGLHFGRLKGEALALQAIADSAADTVIIVVVMPAFAAPGAFVQPGLAETARLFVQARTMLDGRRLLLGCARPHGRDRLHYDVSALLAGFDGVAYPAEGVTELARELGRPADQIMACCGLAAGCGKAA